MSPVANGYSNICVMRRHICHYTLEPQGHICQFISKRVKNCSYVCTTVIYNTAQNSSDNLSSYPPDNHHCSDAVYWICEDSNVSDLASQKIIDISARAAKPSSKKVSKTYLASY